MISRKNRLIIIVSLFCLLLSVQWVFAFAISQDKAASIAQNFLNSHKSFHTIKSVTTFTYEGHKAGYLMNLDPVGYILIASDTIRVPVKAYSMKSDFESLPPSYVKALGRELLVPKLLAAARNDGSNAPKGKSSVSEQKTPEVVNQQYWDFLSKKTTPPSRKLYRYLPNSHLLTTKWNQSYPYNKFLPEYGGKQAITGCVQTAVAQVMKYYAWPQKGSGVFTHTWKGQTFTTSMNRPFYWGIMPDVVGGASPGHEQEEVAALMRGLGILNEAEFGTGGTSSYLHRKSFERAFGYAPIREMDISDHDYFATIRNEIDQDRPVLLRLPGHMTVADGYASDGTGKKIHINMGWGGADNNFYYLDQTITTSQLIFPADNSILYNIKPCKGSECNPYPGTPSGPPVIRYALEDIILAPGTSKTIRIDAYNPGAQDMTFSFTSSCPGIIKQNYQNLLTLGTKQPKQLCDIVVKVSSQDESTSKTFAVLVPDSAFDMGKKYDLGGTFENGSATYKHRVFLEGNVTIRGDCGFSNQGFYIWIKDHDGNVVVPSSEEAVTYFANAGFYTICASLDDPESGRYYPYKPNYSQYILSVSNLGLNTSVRELAEQMGISEEPGLPHVEPLPVNKPVEVLTSASPDIGISSANPDEILVYGCSGPNRITLQKGARMRLRHSLGANTIIIQSESGQFQVRRSGATVYFTGDDGTRLIIPATKTAQKIEFSDTSGNLAIQAGNKIFWQERQISRTLQKL